MVYSEKFREKMVQKMMGPGSMTANALSKEVDVHQSTLCRWIREAKVGGMSKAKDDLGRSRGRRRKRWTPEEKVRVVMEAGALRAEDLGAFLRREGLHEADLERLRDEVRQAAMDGLRGKRQRKGLSPEQKRVRQLEKELRRKDMALAEAAALLVLRGKVRAFLSAEEEGDTDENNER